MYSSIRIRQSAGKPYEQNDDACDADWSSFGVPLFRATRLDELETCQSVVQLIRYDVMDDVVMAVVINDLTVPKQRRRYAGCSGVIVGIY